MDEKYKNFQNFGWNTSEAWKNYLENDLYPKPNSEELISHFKKRFYKSKIDHEFDEKYTPDLHTENTKKIKKESMKNDSKTFCSHHNYSHGHNNDNYHETIEYKKKTIFDNIISSIEAVLWVSYLMNIVLRSELLKVIVLALLTKLLVKYKNKFSADFFTINKKSFNNMLREPHIQLLLYVIILSFAVNLNYLFLFPISITAILSICDYFINYLRIFQFSKKYFQYVIDKSDYLNKLKGFSFVLIGFLATLGLIVRWYGILFNLGFLLYLRNLNNNDSYVSMSLKNIKRWISIKTSHENCPRNIKISIERVISFIEKLS